MSFKGLKPILYGGREVWPLVEGGKGVAATNHMSSGAWAAAGGIGTVSAVNADSYDAEGKIVPQVYDALTRRERHEQLIRFGIAGGVEQVRRAYEISGGKGAININVLWEMGGAQAVLEGILDQTRGMVTGVTCGAGMPYKLSEIAERYNVYYLPIVSSGRAFRALWKRAYHKVPELLGAVVYEDPWLAGGHNGLSNAEDPRKPEDPYPRVKVLRDVMRAEGISDDVPIVMRSQWSGPTSRTRTPRSTSACHVAVRSLNCPNNTKLASDFTVSKPDCAAQITNSSRSVRICSKSFCNSLANSNAVLATT